MKLIKIKDMYRSTDELCNKYSKKITNFPELFNVKEKIDNIFNIALVSIVRKTIQDLNEKYKT